MCFLVWFFSSELTSTEGYLLLSSSLDFRVVVFPLASNSSSNSLTFSLSLGSQTAEPLSIIKGDHSARSGDFEYCVPLVIILFPLPLLGLLKPSGAGMSWRPPFLAMLNCLGCYHSTD